MAKRKVQKKASEKSCETHGCHCRNGMIRIGAMAFILFLVTVWPAVGNWLIRAVPWWVYMIIWIVFCGAAMGMKDKCWCCKK